MPITYVLVARRKVPLVTAVTTVPTITVVLYYCGQTEASFHMCVNKSVRNVSLQMKTLKLCEYVKLRKVHVHKYFRDFRPVHFFELSPFDGLIWDH